jgi:hypothetical protein
MFKQRETTMNTFIMDMHCEEFYTEEMFGFFEEISAADRAKEINEDARAWMAEGEALGEFRWTGMLDETDSHWEQYGIYTASELDAYLDAEHERWTTDADRNYWG